MPIKYALFKNNITADPDDYTAMVQLTDSADGDDLVQDIIDQGTTVRKPDIVAVTAALKLACQRRLEQGQRVNYFGMMDFFPRIKGVFDGPTDSFDSARHHVDVGANPGSELRAAVREAAHVEKVESVKPSPNLVEYRDVGSDTTNDQLTPGQIGQLSGNRLKYDPEAADEGIYIIDQSGGAEKKVTSIQKNKPAQLVFLVPTLPEATYHIEVRARMGSGSSTRELRVGRLDAALTTPPT